VPGEGFEPPTNGLQNRCSTTELTRRNSRESGSRPFGLQATTFLASLLALFYQRARGSGARRPGLEGREAPGHVAEHAEALAGEIVQLDLGIEMHELTVAVGGVGEPVADACAGLPVWHRS
jgi:hypothetical protein